MLVETFWFIYNYIFIVISILSKNCFFFNNTIMALGLGLRFSLGLELWLRLGLRLELRLGLRLGLKLGLIVVTLWP